MLSLQEELQEYELTVSVDLIFLKHFLYINMLYQVNIDTVAQTSTPGRSLVETCFEVGVKYMTFWGP